MPRKKTTPAAKPDAILPDELLEKLIPGPMDAAGVEAVFPKLKKAVIERALGAGLGVHLASPEGGCGNHRNGRSGKTVLTDGGPLRIEVPRDRAGSFEPQLIPKHERRFAGFDDRIISMYARGMSVREIQGHLAEMYAIEVSAEFISAVTDAVMA
ncbi:transposase, partial [Cutibacterium acnes]